jgi:hypothetical protein
MTPRRYVQSLRLGLAYLEADPDIDPATLTLLRCRLDALVSSRAGWNERIEIARRFGPSSSGSGLADTVDILFTAPMSRSTR